MSVSVSPPYASKTAVIRGLISSLLRGEWSAVDRLTESAACERFGVSRPPVREAFLELQALGLVELKRNCGAIVFPFGPDDLKEIYDLRALLEIEATRLATGKIPSEALESLREAFQKIQRGGGSDPDWRYDRELHRLIATGSGNRRLAGEIDRYGNLIQLIREIVGQQNLAIHATSADEHLAIIDGLLSGNPEVAAEAMSRHLGQASRSALLAMDDLRGSGG